MGNEDSAAVLRLVWYDMQASLQGLYSALIDVYAPTKESQLFFVI
jgi:hypothetical protein